MTKARHVSTSYGVTLIELMVTVAIVAIFASIAVPSFRGLIANDRASSTANDLLGALQQTRSEAVRYNRPAEICPLDPGDTTACGTDWSEGWIIRVDRDGNGTLDSDPARVRDNLPSNTTVTATASGAGVSLITFQALGQATAGATFTITHSNPTVTRCVGVAVSGHTAVQNCP